MSIEIAVVIFLLGFVGSFLSGMLGIGGAIINYPMLLYIPALFGLASFSPHEVSGITAVQVLFSTLGGVWAYRKGGYLNKSLIIYMGGSVLLGSLFGGLWSKVLMESAINLIYGALAILAAVLIFIPRKDKSKSLEADELNYNKLLAVMIALIVGVGAGIVGAGGAFLLVPLMLVVLKIPLRITIATSLAITFLSSVGSTIGKISTGQVAYAPAAVLIVASLIASPLGAKLGKIVNTKILQILLALFITGTAIKIWIEILFQ